MAFKFEHDPLCSGGLLLPLRTKMWASKSEDIALRSAVATGVQLSVVSYHQTVYACPVA